MRPPNSLLKTVVRRGDAFRVICFWCLLSCFGPTPASLAQYRFDSWTTDNGVPHNAIRGIWQTRDGYIWLTTWDGVARFDGVRFKNFRPGSTPGLASGQFSYNAMWEDRQGALWMGTYENGVVRYQDGVFSTLTTDDGLPGNHVVRIDEDAEGAVWIFTEGGLAAWKGGRLVKIAPAPGSPFNDCLEVPREKLGRDAPLYGLWRMTDSGWLRFAYGRWTPLPLPPHLKDPAQIHLDTIYEDLRGNLWYTLVGREENYLVQNNQLSIIRDVPHVGISYITYRDSHGRYWVGSHSGSNGFWKDGKFTPLPELTTNNVFRVLEDREGGIWIATLFEGLFKFKEPNITFHRSSGETNYPSVGPILEDSRGRVWASSRVFARFADDRFVNYYRAHRSRQREDWSNFVSALYEDSDGSILVATWDGICRFRDGQLYEEKALSEQVKGRVLAVVRDRAGDLWLGVETGGGLYRFRDGAVTHYTARDGLPNDSIQVLHADSANRLWVGTTKGLSRFTGSRFETPDGIGALSTSSVNSFHEDAAGALWVGTAESGLFRLSGNEGGVKTTHYSTEHGLYSDSVSLIIEDDAGFIWTACHLGLVRVRKQDLEDYAAGRIPSFTSTWFGKTHGLVNEENGAFAEPVGYGFKARDGKLWFSTREGIAVVDPKAMPFNPVPPPVVVEECLLDRHPMDFRQGLHINPGQENLEISYTALSFANSKQIRFRYKLEGLDRDWIEAGTRRTAYYSHVPPGEYTFRVVAANADGAWNTEGRSLRVVAKPPFYLESWFLALALLGVSGAAVIAHQTRIKRLERLQNAQQAFSRQLIESQEGERKRIAAEMHDSLGQHLLIIKNRAALGERFAPAESQVKEQFDEIGASAAMAIGEVRAIAYNLRPLNLERLGLTAVLEEMVENVSGASGIQFSADVELLDHLFAKEDEISFYRIVQESLNNIVKHSGATKANIEIWREGGDLHLVVSDNGRGFDAEALTDGGVKRGLGLTSIAERVRMLGGTQAINSKAQQGTMITVKIPLSDSPDGARK